jgi:hypothetical protein
MNKSDKKIVKGALEVKARVPTKMGLSDFVVPAGTLGYVIASRGKSHCLIYWTGLTRQYKGDHRTGDHSMADLEPTGNRG